jgi:hypothetical protein
VAKTNYQFEKRKRELDKKKKKTEKAIKKIAAEMPDEKSQETTSAPHTEASTTPNKE